MTVEHLQPYDDIHNCHSYAYNYLWKRRWLICGSYNPQGSIISHHLDQLGKLLDFNIRKYENIVLLGDYNCEESEPVMEKFLHTYNLKNLVKKRLVLKMSTTPVPLT